MASSNPSEFPRIDTAPKQRLFIRDLIAPGRTSSPAIFWVQQTGFTNNAKVVPENTQKPYSDIEFTPKITGVSTIAHLFKASKQIWMTSHSCSQPLMQKCATD